MKYRVIYNSNGKQIEYRETLSAARATLPEVGYSGAVKIQQHNGKRWVTIETYE